MDFQEKPKKGHIPGGSADGFFLVYLAVQKSSPWDSGFGWKREPGVF